MRPITKERRRLLIEHCNNELEALLLSLTCSPLTSEEINDIEVAILTHELALASLTSEPIGYTYDRGIGCEIVAADLYGNAKINCDIYSQPSMPVIKLPDEHGGIEHTEYHSGKQEGWNDCLDEIKRLNGLEN